MKIQFAILLGLTFMNVATAMISETVYVESPTDTDNDGSPDLIYVSIERPETSRKLSTLYTISPYTLGGNQVSMHTVDSDLLPQDQEILNAQNSKSKNSVALKNSPNISQYTNDSIANRYAQVKAHSLGTGKSKGCPTVGDMAETLAAKSVIDWLNGRARAFYENGTEAKADWANGSVGMTGVSYNGTLPIMVATTGVEGLKAIVPIAAISSWYDYYRANGLVVNPGGYIGEDADVLGRYIVRKESCKSELERLAQLMGRENGDYTPFWQERDYLPFIKNIKAATFIIHGQADWNVKQKHATQLWNALEGVAPRRMFFHRGGHRSTTEHDVPKKVQDWFDHFLEGDENGITNGPQVEVELSNGVLISQENWPHEATIEERFYLATNGGLSSVAVTEGSLSITDSGRSKKMESLIQNPTENKEGRLIFLTAPQDKNKLLSGAVKVSLDLSVLNRRAANITVAIVEYDLNGNGKIITRGWADPQNHHDLTQSELLNPGQFYQISFELEPKQHLISTGNRIGVVVTSTDFDYTLRPEAGTQIEFKLGQQSYVQLMLSNY